MLKIENLVKDYTSGFLRKRVRVLNDVTFTVNKGEIFGFVGPNGAGKTTTFKVVLGFVSLAGGTVEIMGKPVGDVDMKKHLGYLPENPYFYDYLSGQELLRYMGGLHGMHGIKLEKKIDELLEKLNMSHARVVQLRKYSKGMLQRIGIAQALINDPEFLILDEPLSGLDPIGQREIRELILDQKSNGRTVLLSSHILSDVEALCDRVGVIIDGRIVKTGELENLLEDTHRPYQMSVKNLDEGIIDKLGNLNVEIERRPGVFVLRFGNDVKSRVLDVLSGANGDILSLHPVGKSLEELFVEEAGKSDHVEV